MFEAGEDVQRVNNYKHEVGSQKSAKWDLSLETRKVRSVTFTMPTSALTQNFYLTFYTDDMLHLCMQAELCS